MNTQFLQSQQTNYNLQTLLCSLLSKTLNTPSQKFLQTSTFYHIFTSFHDGWEVQYFKQTLIS